MARSRIVREASNHLTADATARSPTPPPGRQSQLGTGDARSSKPHQVSQQTGTQKSAIVQRPWQPARPRRIRPIPAYAPPEPSEEPRHEGGAATDDHQRAESGEHAPCQALTLDLGGYSIFHRPLEQSRPRRDSSEQILDRPRHLQRLSDMPLSKSAEVSAKAKPSPPK